MYIVKETDEDSINKAAELAGERSKKLADTIKDILALRGKDKLSVEIIEEAIDIVDGKKKPTDLIPRRLVRGLTYVRPEDKFLTDLVAWGFHAEEPEGICRTFAKELIGQTFAEEPEGICRTFAKEDIVTMRVFTSKSKISPYRIRKAKKARSFAWDYFLKDTMIHTDLTHDKLSERRMLLVRSR